MQEETITGRPNSSSRSLPWFTAEIQQMMYGFGDCPNPLASTAVLIEKTVHNQITTVLHKALDVASSRGSKVVGMEDLLFLLRKNKPKLKRVLQYLRMKDTRSNMTKCGDEAEDKLDQQGDPLNWGSGDSYAASAWFGPRMKAARRFLSSIDTVTYDLLRLCEDTSLDPVKRERLVRADAVSQTVDSAQYTDFQRARSLSLSNTVPLPNTEAGQQQASKAQARSRPARLKEWLVKGLEGPTIPGVAATQPPHVEPWALDMLNILVYEGIAEIVDLCLLVRKDGARSNLSPIDRLSSPRQAVREKAYNIPPLILDGKKRKASGEIITNGITPDEVREVLRRSSQPSQPFPSSFTKKARLCL